MPLLAYEEVKAYGALVQQSVVERSTPPWLAEGSGSCGDFRDTEWLSDEEIAMISDWVDAGMPEGEDPSLLVVAPEGAELTDATHDLVPEGSYTPGTDGGADDWRGFVSEPGLTEDAFLTAWQVIPEHPAIVHHATIFIPIDEQAAQETRALDTAEQGEGYTCFGDARVAASLGAIWSPGRSVYRLPEGVGIRISPGIPMMMQLHYALDGSVPTPDRTTMKVRLDPVVDLELHQVVLMNDSFVAPPGEPARSWSESFRLGDELKEQARFDYDGPMGMIGAAIHMHLMGTAAHLEAGLDDGTEACLIDVPRWDHAWHNIYFYEDPVPVDTDTIFDLSCTWDTTGQTTDTVWGDNLDQQLCAALMPAVIPAR